MKPTLLPDDCEGKERCTKFANFFVGKIKKTKDDIKHKMDEDGVQRLTCNSSKPSTERINFEMKTEAEIKKHILSMQTKHCGSNTNLANKRMPG